MFLPCTKYRNSAIGHDGIFANKPFQIKSNKSNRRLKNELLSTLFLKKKTLHLSVGYLLVCGGSSDVINCGISDEIVIQNATISRTVMTTCPYHAHCHSLDTATTSCLSTVTGTLADICNYQNSCNVTATSQFFVDSCLDSSYHGYLSVHYECVPGRQK